MNMSKNLLRNKIRDTRKTDCRETISLCNRYLTMDFLKKEDVWFANHNLSKMYKQTGDIDLAIRCSILALQNTDEMCPDYILTSWMLGCCLEENKDIHGAINEYTKCSKLYKNIGEQYHRIGVVFNIAKLKCNVPAMLRIIHIAESTDLDKILEDYKDLDNIIYKMCIELIDYCIKVGAIDKIPTIFYKIDNKTLKNSIKKYYLKSSLKLEKSS